MLNENTEIPMDVSNITEVSKIDYTNSKNPSAESENSKGIYNNQIQSIEEIPASNPRSQRIRLTLKDGMSIPEGGSIVLAALGSERPSSTDLIKDSDTIGTIQSFTHAYNNPRTTEGKLRNTKTVDEYIKLFESMTSGQLPSRSYVLTFNSKFSKLNLNRVVEFEIDRTSSRLVDASLIRKAEAEVGDSTVIDSNGTNHKLRKNLTSYLLNPYDTKGLSLGNVQAYITFGQRPRVTPISNELTLSAGYTVLNKPNYLDTVMAPSFDFIRVSNRDINSDKIVASKGDTFKFELSDNSLFATSDYSVGDIVSFDSFDKVLKEYTISGNRFTDTDKYITTQAPSSDASSDVKVSYRFKLVEKTDKTYKWELLDDISLTNSVLFEDLDKLTPTSLRKDWVSRFGKDNLKNYLSGIEKYPDRYLTNGQLKGKAITNIKGVTKEVPLTSIMTKNTNLVVGENSTGTVKVIHKTDTGMILNEETVATNQPWHQPLTIDPKTTFTDYVFKSASETLSTIVGTGNRTIELVYAKPKTSTKEIPPKVTYVVDNSKEGTYRNEVAGKPTIETTNTTYVYDETTRTASEKVTKSTVEGTPTVVTLGTKPTTEVTYQDFNTRYVADPNRAAGEKFTETEGVRGTTATTTTYSVNTETGVVTPTKGQPQVVAPTDKVVKVGTKSTTQTTVIPKGTVYQEDRDAEFESRTTLSEGHDGSTTTTTTYTLNEQNGEVTPKTETATVEKEDKIIKVGNRKTEITTEPLKTIYVGDESIEFEKKNEIDAGTPKKHTSTLRYDIDSMTGALTNPKEEEFSDIVEVPRKIAVGNKKVVTEPIRATNRYVGNEEKERGYSNLIEQGRDGSRTITTIYTVNEKTGNLSNPTSAETSTPMTRNVYEVGAKPTITYLKEQNKIVKYTTRVKVDEDTGGLTDITSTETISEDGAKDKIVTEELASPVRYEKDDQRARGEEDVRTEGKTGTKVTTTTHEVNPKTGEVIPTVHEPVINSATETVVKVAAKDKVVFSKDGNKVIKTTTTYTVDPTNGNVTETSAKETISEDGAKDKIVTEELASPVRYEKDDQRARGEEDVRTEGKTGTKVTTTTHEVNPKTGEVIPTVHEPVINSATETVVKVAAKDKVVFSKDGNKVIKTTTTYTVDPTNGNVTETSAKETLSEDGAKDKIVTEELASPIRYEKDDTREKGSENIRTEGKTGTKVTTTTHEVNPKTGEVIPTVHEPVINSATETVVKVAAKDKVVFSKDGNKVIKTTTTYTVDPTNGNVTETSAKETLSEDGAKDKIVTEVVEPKVVYEKDDSREVGSENIEISGKPGKKIVTFTHTVDEMTGKVIVAKSEKIIENATDTVVKVAAKDKFEVIEKDGKAFERHTVYTVNSQTGEISRKFDDKEITDKVSKSKKLPNTGLENASDLGAAAVFGLAAIVAIRRRLNQ